MMRTEAINVIANILIGITAIVSLWFSIKALKRLEWSSAMNTAPSIIIRPKDIWIGSRRKEEGGYGVVEPNGIIKQGDDWFKIVFIIEFECFNAGRGVAFNIKQPQVEGFTIVYPGYGKIPFYQTLNDESFVIKTQIEKNFKEWEESEEIPVELTIMYTNDQNTIFCKSSWVAKAKPFKILDDGKLKARKLRLLSRRSKIEYSSKISNKNL